MQRILPRALALLLVFSCNNPDPVPPPRDRPHPDMAPHFEQLDGGVDAGTADVDGGDKADGGVDAGEVADGGAEDGGDSSDAG